MMFISATHSGWLVDGWLADGWLVGWLADGWLVGYTWLLTSQHNGAIFTESFLKHLLDFKFRFSIQVKVLAVNKMTKSQAF